MVASVQAYTLHQLGVCGRGASLIAGLGGCAVLGSVAGGVGFVCCYCVRVYCVLSLVFHPVHPKHLHTATKQQQSQMIKRLQLCMMVLQAATMNINAATALKKYVNAFICFCSPFCLCIFCLCVLGVKFHQLHQLEAIQP